MSGQGILRYEVGAALNAERKKIGFAKRFLRLHTRLAVTESVSIDGHPGGGCILSQFSIQLPPGTHVSIKCVNASLQIGPQR